MYFNPTLRYADILSSVNLDTLNVRRDSICQIYLDKINVGIPNNIIREFFYPLLVTRTNRFRNCFISWALYNCQ